MNIDAAETTDGPAEMVHVDGLEHRIAIRYGPRRVSVLLSDGALRGLAKFAASVALSRHIPAGSNERVI